MPSYSYSHPKTKKIIDIFQSMTEEHIYIDKDGIQWDRVFYSPQASIDGNIDPFSERQFIEKTQKPDTIGALWDRSKELSEKRAKANGGVDPIRKKAEKDYSKARGGKKYRKKI